jgi:S-adenosylmethionine-diacylglycerol 3-amino-3-carboxypropyl transferase
MTQTLSLKDTTQTARNLLSSAVHKHRSFSIEGLLERAFTYAFNGLVYPQIWEDPDVDLKAMAIEPHHHIVTIASGGCNALSYLTANPARITAVDLSPAHEALVKLKIAGLRQMQNWETYYRFFGKANTAESARLYEDCLRDHLEPHIRQYWEGRMINGRRRVSHFERNIYRKGLLGRFIGLGHLLAKLGGTDLRNAMLCETLAEQREFFDNKIAPLFDRRIVRWLTSYRASLFGLGIPPSQFEALANGRTMSLVLRDRLERLTCSFPFSQNYFAWQAFDRAYAPDASGPLPPYLQRAHFETLRQRANRLTMLHASLTDTLQNIKPESVDRVVLLDAQDWMSDEQLNALWSAISQAAAPGARVIFRTAGSETILPGRVNHSILGRWSYLKEISQELHAQDRSSIYGGFHVYQLND